MAHIRHALPIAAWPEGDLALWSKASTNLDPFEDPGGAAHWRPKTRRTVTMHYGLWLSFLRDHDLLDVTVAPTTRATREYLSAYLEDLRVHELAPITIAGQFRDIREALRVMEPDSDLAVLNHTVVRLQCSAEPSRVKRLAVISPALILDAAIAEMARQQRAQERRPSRRTAERYRDALIIAFLATRPIRLANLTSILLGHHFVNAADGYWCRFRGEETKDAQALAFPMPASLTIWLDRYIATHSSLLFRKVASDHLWVNIRATPMQENSIYYQVCRVTKRLLGHRINPHLFRDCAATFIAEQAPEQVRIIARILGHSTLRASEEHYNQAGMLSAQQRYLAVLETQRDGLQPPTSP